MLLRRPAALLATMLVALALPATASAAGSCSLAGNVLTVTVTAGLNGTLSVNGTNIQYDGVNCTGGATTATTDTINVAPSATGSSETLSIDLSGGAFAPGLTNEGATSEIEFAVNLGDDTVDRVIINGSAGSDIITGGASGFELDNGNDDIDLTLSNTEWVQFNGNNGNDSFSGAGSPLTGGVSSLKFELDGGNGGDTLTGGSGGDSLYEGNDTGVDTLNGGAGADTLYSGGPNATGADTFTGGPGTDMADYSARTDNTKTLGLNLDNGAFDGEVGVFENDFINTDVEGATGGAANDYVYGDQVNPDNETLIGGDGDDLLSGGPGDDYIDAGAGNQDTIDEGFGPNGTDTLLGGPGNYDTISYQNRWTPTTIDLGSSGNGETNPTSENDTIGTDFENAYGGSDDDIINLEGSDDDMSRIYAGNGNDSLNGGEGADLEDGGTGNDFFNQGTTANGDDQLYMGLGDDTLNYAARSLSVDVSLGNGTADEGDTASNEKDVVNSDGSMPESVQGGSGNDVLAGDGGANTMLGGPGNDTFNPDGGIDTYYGEAGADHFLAGASTFGNDAYHGGTQLDTLDYSSRSAAVDVSVDGVADDGDTLTSETDNAGTDVEVIYGTIYNDLLANGPSNGVLLMGNDGDDSLVGGAGAEGMYGEDGDDSFDMGSVADGNDNIEGGTGTDTADYSDRLDSTTVQIGVAGGSGSVPMGEADFVNTENVYTGIANDTITGDAGNNVIGGGAGTNILSGGAGNDTFEQYALLTGMDNMNGGADADTVNYGNRTDFSVAVDNDGSNDDGASGELDRVQNSVENFEGTQYGDNLTGSALGETNVINGNGGPDNINGSQGDDFLNGGGGDDFINEEYVENGDDDITGGTGNDTISYGGRTDELVVTLDDAPGDGEVVNGENDNIGSDFEDINAGEAGDNLTGNSGDNEINGGQGEDHIYGLGGTDTLSGDDDNDQLTGGTGNDELSGGAGNDISYASDDVVPDGNDEFDGGDDEDTVDYTARTQTGVTVTLATADDDGDQGNSETDDTASVENVNGSNLNDVLSGDSAANHIVGNDGIDATDGQADDDTLEGNAGNDAFLDGDEIVSNDDFDGGAGTGDSVNYSGRMSAVNVTLDDSSNDGYNGSEFDNVRGNIEIVTLTANNDIFTGGAFNDTVNAGAGNDVIEAGETPDGNDVVRGEAGTDIIDYGDRLAGVVVTLDGVANDGNTTAVETDNIDDDVEDIDGSQFADTLTGSDAVNTITSNDGNDTITGGLEDDTLDGGDDNDTFLASTAVDGDDNITGGGGTGDVLSYAARSLGVMVELGDGGGDIDSGELDALDSDIETLIGSGDDDNLKGSANNDTVDGGPGNDAISGGLGDDELTGGTGNDTFDEGALDSGEDDIDGGAGLSDTINYAFRTAPVTITLDSVAVNDDGESGEGDNITTIERAFGGTVNDTLTGSGAAELLDGQGGADTVAGGAGNDTLVDNDSAPAGDTYDGGAGDDAVDYSARNDALTLSANDLSDDGVGGEGDNIDDDIEDIIGGSEADTISGDTGTVANELFGGPGNDTFVADSDADGADVLNGEAGIDRANYGARLTSTVSLSLNGQPDDGTGLEGDSLVAIEQLTGGNLADVLYGDGNNNDIVGGGGNDTITGGAGADTLAGGLGNDAFAEGNASNGADTFVGNGGVDSVSYVGRAAKVTVIINNGAADGEAGELDNVRTDIENVTGGAGPDVLTGGTLANTLIGLNGNDVINGGAGNDNLQGGNGNDTITGGAGTDKMTGAAGADKINSKDNKKEKPNCGAGKDRYRKDARDRPVSCEKKY